MKRNDLLQASASTLSRFLQDSFAEHSGAQDWWQARVVRSLSTAQAGQVRARNLTKLEQLDLAALLRIFQQNFSELSYWRKLPQESKTLSYLVIDLRNAEAHSPTHGEELDAEAAWRAADAVLRFVGHLGAEPEITAQIGAARTAALRLLASAQFGSAPTPSPTSPTASAPVEATPPPPRSVQTQAAAAGSSVASLDELGPVAARLGPCTIHGPGALMPGELMTFLEKSVPATTVPWRVRGPNGLDLSVHLSLIDDPSPDEEAGQVQCDSRNGSAARWDDIVKRLRVGLRTLPDGEMHMDLRTAVPKVGGRPTREVLQLRELSAAVNLDAIQALKVLGATKVATRAEAWGDTSRVRNYPCVVFRRDALVLPVAGWVLTTVLPIDAR